MPKISVVIAAYNVDKYLKCCISSILNQDIEDLEVIIVNDGSTDNTRNIIEELQEKDKRIVLIDQSNSGVSKTRNVGLDKATGEYVLFVDGDDWIQDNCLKKLYNLAKRENADVVCYNYFYAFENKNIISNDFKSFDKLNNEQFIRASLLLEVAPVLWCKLLKREVLIRNMIKCPEDIAFGEDMATSINIALNSKNILFLNEPLYFYRQRNDSISKELSEKVLTIDKAMKFIEEKLKINNKMDLFRHEYQFLVYRNIYYYLVINNNKVNRVQRELYRMWIRKGIYIKNNKYYLEFIKSFDKKLKLKHFLYNKSYYLGAAYSKAIENLKRVKIR